MIVSHSLLSETSHPITMASASDFIGRRSIILRIGNGLRARFSIRESPIVLMFSSKKILFKSGCPPDTLLTPTISIPCF
jgi:hypothetical protein